MQEWIDLGYDELEHDLIKKYQPDGSYKIIGFQGKSTPPEALRIRKITKSAFWKRLGLMNRAKLIQLAKEDSLIQAQLETIADSEYIDLDDPDLVLGLEGLNAAGVLSSDAIANALANGVESERPELLKD